MHGGFEWGQSSDVGFYRVDRQSLYVESSFGTKQKKASVQ